MADMVLNQQLFHFFLKLVISCNGHCQVISGGTVKSDFMFNVVDIGAIDEVKDGFLWFICMDMPLSSNFCNNLCCTSGKFKIM